MPARYRRLSFDVEPGGLDRLTAELWQRGTLGIEQTADDGSLVAYFRNDAPAPDADWRGFGGRLVASEELAESDWMAAYRERSCPIEVGRRLLVDPREPERSGAAAAAAVASGLGRHLLRLPARTAFGTGSHPSTALVIELLEDLDLRGARVLDVGAGSGILSFAALIFGAGRVVGVEIDLAAALVAAQNRAANRLHPAFLAGGLGALEPHPRFEMALVNVLPSRIEGEIGALRSLLRSGARAIFSGILTDAAPAVGERLQRAGFEPVAERARDEWTALLTSVEGR